MAPDNYGAESRQINFFEQIMHIPLSFLTRKKTEIIRFRAVVRADEIGMTDINIPVFSLNEIWKILHGRSPNVPYQV